MILEALKGLAALPRLVDAVEALGDIARVEMARKRKTDKDEMLDDLIADARKRRLHRRETERVSGDSGEESSGA